MRKSKLTDFILCAGALAASATIALLAALRAIEANTALVFLSLSVACIAMSLINFESPSSKKKR